MPYATEQDVRTIIGEDRLSGWGIGEGEGAAIAELLRGAAAEIEDAFGGAGYVVPLDLSSLSAERAANFASQLKLCAVYLAAEPMAVQAPEMPEALAEYIKRWREWLRLIRQGTSEIPGLAKEGDSQGDRARGRVVYVRNGRRTMGDVWGALDGLPREYR